jgi:hypothetical protein
MFHASRLERILQRLGFQRIQARTGMTGGVESLPCIHDALSR